MAEAIGHRLHSSSSAFSLDEPAFLLNNSAVTAAATATATGITGSTSTGASLTAGATSAAGSLGFANLLPVNFVTTPLPTNALQERISLVCAAFHLALCVTVRTAWPRVHWRRREMLGWAVSTGLLAGPPALLHLTQAWSLYASPREAVTWLAPTLLACIACVSPVGGPASLGVGTGANGGAGVGGRSARSSAEDMLFLLPRIYSFFSFTPLAVEQIKVAVRQMTIQVGPSFLTLSPQFQLVLVRLINQCSFCYHVVLWLCRRRLRKFFLTLSLFSHLKPPMFALFYRPKSIECVANRPALAATKSLHG